MDGVERERGRGAVQECFFCPSYFLSPYFSKYTNDYTLKINHILVQFLYRDFFSVAYSIWVRRLASAYLLSEPTIFLGKCLYQVRNVLFFSCSVDWKLRWLSFLSVLSVFCGLSLLNAPWSTVPLLLPLFGSVPTNLA